MIKILRADDPERLPQLIVRETPTVGEAPMPLRGQIFASLTNSGAKRFGLSCAIISAFAAIVLSKQGEDMYRLRRFAEDSAVAARAEKLGLDPWKMKQQVRSDCAKKSANLDTADQCYNVEMFGSFGEILERHYQ